MVSLMKSFLIEFFEKQCFFFSSSNSLFVTLRENKMGLGKSHVSDYF